MPLMAVGWAGFVAFHVEDAVVVEGVERDALLARHPLVAGERARRFQSAWGESQPSAMVIRCGRAL